MVTGKRVQILLSTYQGERYLREQLESYLHLEHFDQCAVLIRDDGSTDGTRTILETYRHLENFTIAYGDNVGITKSYRWLLEHADPSCAYFAFSDQDDVWLPDKLTRAMALLDREDSATPLLFASRSRITDSDLTPTGASVDPVRGISFYNAMVQNVLPGHTQVFNRALCTQLLTGNFDAACVIDWWLYLLASGLGKVVYSPAVTVLHRQHGDNAVGYQQGFWKSIRRRLHEVRQGKGNLISLQLQSFFRQYGKQLPAAYGAELEGYLSALPTVTGRIAYLGRCRLFRQRRGEDALFRALYLLGKYNLKK